MAIVFIIIAIVAILGGTVFGSMMLYDSKKHLAKYGYKNKLTGPSRAWPVWRILEEFNKLPQENRPDIDILTVLLALETKYGGEKKIDKHFEQHYYGGDSRGTWSWECGCNRNKSRGWVCDMEEFHVLRETIQDLHTELANQTYALEMAKIQSNVDEADALVERLRDETVLVKNTTLELTQRSSQ